MRVTILGKDFPPALSGIGDHTDHLAAELARRGNTVSVVCSPPAEQREAFEVRGVIPRWDAAGFDDLVSAVGATTPDVILWQYNPFSIGSHGIALSAGRLARALASTARVVVMAHELWFPWGRDGLRGFAWALAQRAQIRGVLKASTDWIVTTPSREASLARRDAVKTHRIPVGPNVVPCEHGAADARARLDIPPSAFLLSHFGAAGPGRDLRPAYGALKLLRDAGLDIHLVLAGKTGDVSVPTFARDAVHITGILSNDELSHVLSASDAFLCSDPIGPAAGRHGSLVAALAHGLPILAYPGPDATPELLDGRDLVLVQPEARALSVALRTLSETPERARALSENARARYEEFFSWSRIGEQVTGVLERR